MKVTQTIKALTIIPGVGKSIATDLYNIGIRHIDDLKGKDPNNFTTTQTNLQVAFKTGVYFMFLGVPYILQKHRQTDKTAKN